MLRRAAKGSLAKAQSLACCDYALKAKGQKGAQSLAESARLARCQPEAVRLPSRPWTQAALPSLRCGTVAVLPLPTQGAGLVAAKRHQAAVAEVRRHLGGGGKRGWLA